MMTSSTPRPIRILHVLYVMNVGGVETWLLQLLRHINRDRFEIDFLVHVLHPSSYTGEIRALGSQIIVCPHPRKFLTKPWLYSRTFKQLLCQYGPYDIIHSHAAHFSGYILGLARQVGIPIRIAHSHDDTSARDTKAAWHRRLYVAVMKWLIGQNATIGLAASQKAAACLFGSNWTSDTRWQVLHCGIDLIAWQQQIDRAAVRAELGIPSDAFVIGHVGRLNKQKNPLFIVEIATQVAQIEPKMCLLFVGDGDLRPEIEAKVQKLGLSDRVIFAGFRSDIANLMLGTMDVFLFPSLHEGLGLALVEAQAAGLPCIFSDLVPEEADVVKPLVRRISLLKHPSVWADAVLAARNSPFTITKAEALATVVNSPFNIEISVKKMAKLYEHNFS